MKQGDIDLITLSVLAGVVLSLTVPTKSQTTAEFPILVGMYIEQHMMCHFRKPSRG